MPESPTHPTLPETLSQSLDLSPNILDDYSRFSPEEQTTDSPDGLPLACVASLATTQEVALDPTIPAEQRMSLKEKFLRSRIGHAALTGLAALGLAGGMAVLDAAPAFAESGPVYTVVNPDHDGTYSIYDRNSPHWADSNRRAPDFSRYGDRLQLICGTNGEAVGPYNNRRWHYANNLSRPEAGTTWIPDRYLNTPNKANQRTPGERECGGGSQSSPNGETEPYKKSYDGNKAASWALTHARDPQEYGVNDEDCAWFVSQALVAGGIAQNDTFHLWGHYGFPHIPGTNVGSGAPGTATTWLAPKLLNYILTTYPDSTWKELSFSQNNQPDIKPGDIIAYDWDPKQGNGIDHLSIVVGDAPGTQYPEVAEWGNVPKTGMSATYVKRGWTWSKTSNPPQWITKATGGQAKAYVLHVDTGLDGVQIAGSSNGG